MIEECFKEKAQSEIRLPCMIGLFVSKA